MNKDYNQAIDEWIDVIASNQLTREELNKATLQLAKSYLKINDINSAKSVVSEYWSFHRKDLLWIIAKICQEEQSTSFAEKLIGDIRCYTYAWLDFCTEMQQLYFDLGDKEKAREISASVVDVAFSSICPATRAMIQCLKTQGKISDSTILKDLYKEIKRIKNENILRQGD